VVRDLEDEDFYRTAIHDMAGHGSAQDFVRQFIRRLILINKSF
jgi:hypothetical protein